MEQLKDEGSKNSANAIVEIERIVKEATRTTVMSVPHEPDGVYFLVGPDGSAQRRIAAPPWHNEKLATPAELRSFIENHATEKSVVFLDDTTVVFVRDLDDRRDRATCTLLQTPQYLWLTKQSAIPHSQAELVRVLRIVLRGCLPPDSTLLGLIRNLKFQAAQDGSMTIQHTRESLGKQVTAQINADHAIPEEIRLHVPVLENHPFIAGIACAIEVMPSDQKFKLTPYPLETRKAMDEALGSIEELLVQEGLPPVYRGQP